MMTMTTYPETTERPVTRAEIERLTQIIERLEGAIEWLNASLDRDTATIRRLRHEIDVQVRKQQPPPIQPAKSWSDGEDELDIRVAEWERLKDD